MSGTISSLGMGSGVLTSSVIDQLKANDTTLMVTPIQNKITTNTQQQQSMSLLQSLATSFGASVSTLQNASTFQNTTVTGTTSSVNVTADNGVSAQNFTIANTKLATSDVVQSGSFTSSTATIAKGTGSLNMNVNGVNYAIPYTASTTYSDLQTAINDAAGTSVKASILQTGTSAYSLVLNSQSTGAAQQIGITDLSGNLNSTLTTNSLKSDSFASSTSSIATGSGTLTLGAGAATSTFDYTATTSLSDLATMINSDPTASANVNAAVVKNDAGTYNLVLTAKGSNQSDPITLSDQASGGSLNTQLTTGTTTTSGTLADIQAASDASFQYNGITLTRASNTITDITPGMTINLLATDPSTANINITQNTQPIKDALQSLATTYNSLQAQLQTMTVSDTTNISTTPTGTANSSAALFSGNSSLTSIQRDMDNILSSSSSSGLSLMQYGLSFNSDGTMSFDSTAFDTTTAKSPTNMANYFSGQTTVDSFGNTHTTDGVFNTLNNYMNNLTGSNGSLTVLTNGLTTAATQLQTNETNMTALINQRYTTMSNQFVAYDTMMTNMTNSFAPLLSTISAAAYGK